MNPATKVPSRSKNAPIFAPAGLAMISATEPGSRMSAPVSGVSSAPPLDALMSPTPIETTRPTR